MLNSIMKLHLVLRSNSHGPIDMTRIIIKLHITIDRLTKMLHNV